VECLNIGRTLSVGHPPFLNRDTGSSNSGNKAVSMMHSTRETNVQNAAIAINRLFGLLTQVRSAAVFVQTVIQIVYPPLISKLEDIRTSSRENQRVSEHANAEVIAWRIQFPFISSSLLSPKPSPASREKTPNPNVLLSDSFLCGNLSLGLVASLDLSCKRCNSVRRGRQWVQEPCIREPPFFPGLFSEDFAMST